jgi:hypothetical protein
VTNPNATALLGWLGFTALRFLRQSKRSSNLIAQTSNLKRQNYLADTFFSGCSLFCSRTTTKTTPNQNNKEQQNNKTAFGHSLHKLQQRGATTNINKS